MNHLIGIIDELKKETPKRKGSKQVRVGRFLDYVNVLEGRVDACRQHLERVKEMYGEKDHGTLFWKNQLETYETIARELKQLCE